MLNAAQISPSYDTAYFAAEQVHTRLATYRVESHWHIQPMGKWMTRENCSFDNSFQCFVTVNRVKSKELVKTPFLCRRCPYGKEARYLLTASLTPPSYRMRRVWGLFFLIPPVALRGDAPPYWQKQPPLDLVFGVPVAPPLGQRRGSLPCI